MILCNTHILLADQICAEVCESSNFHHLVLVDRPDSSRQYQGRGDELLVGDQGLEAIWNGFKVLTVRRRR